jgi:hypothetical protein
MKTSIPVDVEQFARTHNGWSNTTNDGAAVIANQQLYSHHCCLQSTGHTVGLYWNSKSMSKELMEQLMQSL